jgi:methylglutaconyl-CoA hydratase
MVFKVDDLLQLSYDTGITTVTLNRPDVKNAFNSALVGSLTRTFIELGQDASVRCIVLAAQGKAFCAGADLNWMRAMADYNHAQNVADAQGLADMLHTIYACPKPTIARVQGDAFAGGMGLIAACDVAVAVSTARFCLSEVKLGLIPGTIAPYVARAIGARAAHRYALTAEIFDATVAKNIGLVHEVAHDEAALDAQIKAWCANFAAASPQALADCKRLLNEVAHAENTPQLRTNTAHYIAHSRASSDGKAGVQAFLNKGTAPWLNQ